MGKLSSLSASEGATYKKRTIFYIAIKVEDNIKAVQCQLNWCSWQVYGLKICWQLEASAKKKANIYYATVLRISAVFELCHYLPAGKQGEPALEEGPV